MVTKEPVPQSFPVPEVVSPAEMDERALRFAATALLERLIATEQDVDEVGVQALVFNLQNLMRLFDRTSYRCEIANGEVTFVRTVSQGDWETGQWSLEWESRRDSR